MSSSRAPDSGSRIKDQGLRTHDKPKPARGRQTHWRLDMSVARFLGAAVLAGVACSVAASAQPFRPCTNPEAQSTTGEDRRLEGLNAARVINTVLNSFGARP